MPATGAATCANRCASPTAWRGCAREGYRHFLEVGPHPTLTALAQRSLPERDSHFADLAASRQGRLGTS